MTSRNHTGAIALLLTLLAASPAMAQESTDDHAARVAFDSGHDAFADGRFADALADFTRAYDLSHRPELLYNIGLAADRLRHDEDAITAFEAYLEALPEAENRAEVQRRLRALRDAVAAEATVAYGKFPHTRVPSAAFGALAMEVFVEHGCPVDWDGKDETKLLVWRDEQARRAHAARLLGRTIDEAPDSA